MQYSDISTSALIVSILRMSPRGGKKHSQHYVRHTTPSPQLIIKIGPMGWYTLQITSWMLVISGVDLPHTDVLPIQSDMLSWLLQKSVQWRTTASSLSSLLPTVVHVHTLSLTSLPSLAISHSTVSFFVPSAIHASAHSEHSHSPHRHASTKTDDRDSCTAG